MANDFTPLKCHIHKDYNVIFDEKGSTCGTVRSVQWLKDDAEPDPLKAKLEIRKIYNSADGEKNGKGYTFSTEDGPSELIYGLIDAGFGNTKEILTHIKDRKDFPDAVKAISFEPEEDESGEVFDMRDLLLSELDEEEA